jgi:hypothetical protein
MFVMCGVLFASQQLPEKYAVLSIFLAASAALVALAVIIHISFCLRCPRCSGWIAMPKCPACGLKLADRLEQVASRSETGEPS